MKNEYRNKLNIEFDLFYNEILQRLDFGNDPELQYNKQRTITIAKQINEVSLIEKSLIFQSLLKFFLKIEIQEKLINKLDIKIEEKKIQNSIVIQDLDMNF